MECDARMLFFVLACMQQLHAGGNINARSFIHLFKLNSILKNKRKENKTNIQTLKNKL